MSFVLTITHKDRTYAIKVERTQEGAKDERFRISGGGRFISLQTNRPHAVARGHTPKWKIIDGHVRKESNLQEATLIMREIFKAIEKHYEALERSGARQGEIDSFNR